MSLTAAINLLHTFFFCHQHLICITDKIQHLDVRLKLNNDHHRKDRTIVRRYLICSLSYLTYNLCFCSVLQGATAFLLFTYFFYVYLNLGGMSNELQYIALCQIIRSRFAVVNQRLSDLLKRQMKSGATGPTIQNELRTLREAHLTLARLAKQTNASFNTRLFISFFCCLVNMLGNLYLLIFEETLMFGPQFWDKIYVLGAIFTRASFFFVRLTLLCLASQILCKEVSVIFELNCVDV